MPIEQTDADPLTQFHHFDIIHKPGCLFPSTRCIHEAFTIDGRLYSTPDALAADIAAARAGLTAAEIEHHCYSLPASQGVPKLPDWPTWRAENLAATGAKSPDAQ